jgi:hypothetical protein
MKNVTREVTKFGAGLKITFKGAPANVAAEVNRLFNHGVLTEIPDDYNEGTDDSVTCNSYRPRFLRGLRSMAEADMRKVAIPQADSFLGLAYRMDRRTWRTISMIRAARLARELFEFKRQGWRKGAAVEGAGVEVALG